MAYGDAVILPGGERVEGKILRQNSEQVVIEVEVSSGVIDTRTYQVSEIKSVEKESADQVAYQKLIGIKSQNDSAMPSDYDRMIADLKAFKRRFPSSSFLPAIEDNLKALEADKQKVEEGGVKLNGTWLTAEQVQKNRYQIEARSLFGQMSGFAKNGDYISALNAFDSIETQYPNSSSYPEGILLAQKIIPALTADVARKKVIATRDEEQRLKGVEITSEPRKSQLIAAYNTEQEQFKKLVAEAASSKIKWPPLIQRSPESIDAVEKIIVTEQTRLSALNVSGMQKSLIQITRAEAALARKDIEAARSALDAAKQDWSNNEGIKQAEEELKGLEAAAAEESKTQAAAEKEKEDAAKETKGKPEAKSKPTPAAPPEKKPTAETIPTPAASSAIAEVSVTPSARPMEEVPVVPAAEEKPFYRTVGGAVVIVGGVAAAAGAVAVLGKVKKPATDEDPEV